MFASLSAIFMSACTSVGLGIANVPNARFKGETHKSIEFDTSTKQSLDIYIPAHASKDKALPVVVFFYGGRWTSGTKEQYKFVGPALAEKGFIVVIPDYRKYPKVRFPSFVEDGAHAVNWVHENIGQYGGNADRLFLAGHSSGAHIASLLASDEQYLKPESFKALKGFAGLAGPYAFVPEAKDLKDMFGPPSEYPKMRAVNYIDGNEPPMLLLHGEDDTTVTVENLESLEKAIQEKGGQVEKKVYENVNHLEIMGAVTWFWRHKAPVLNDMAAFFRRQP